MNADANHAKAQQHGGQPDRKGHIAHAKPCQHTHVSCGVERLGFGEVRIKRVQIKIGEVRIDVKICLDAIGRREVCVIVSAHQ